MSIEAHANPEVRRGAGREGEVPAAAGHSCSNAVEDKQLQLPEPSLTEALTPA
jgi:hypothetical protein